MSSEGTVHNMAATDQDIAHQPPDGPSPLLNLPSELRLIIYDFIFDAVPNNEYIKLLESPSKHPECALTAVNREIRKEVLPVYEESQAAFWRTNRFYAEIWYGKGEPISPGPEWKLSKCNLQLVESCSKLVRFARLQDLYLPVFGDGYEGHGKTWYRARFTMEGKVEVDMMRERGYSMTFRQLSGDPWLVKDGTKLLDVEAVVRYVLAR